MKCSEGKLGGSWGEAVRISNNQQLSADSGAPRQDRAWDFGEAAASFSGAAPVGLPLLEACHGICSHALLVEVAPHIRDMACYCGQTPQSFGQCQEALIAVEPKPGDAPSSEDCEVAGLYNFDVVHLKWSDAKYSSLPTGVFHIHAVDLEGGCAYAVASSAIMRLDLKTKMWEVLADPHVKRRRFAGAVLQNRFWIIGGTAQNSPWCEWGEIWDPISREWTLVPQLYQFDDLGLGTSYWPITEVAVLMDWLYALRSSTASMTELMYYEASSKLWKSLGRVGKFRIW